MSLSVLIIALLILLATLHAVLLTLQSWECRRFALRRLAAVPSKPAREKRTAIIIPCKGHDLDLARNLTAAFQQAFRNFEIVFVVEAADDPAVRVVRHLCDQHPTIQARLVCAGRSTHHGQKIHGLLAAVDQLSDDVELLAFLDSDARPGNFWLPTMAATLERPGVGAVTGYRWLIPRDCRLGNLLVYSVNSAIAGLLGPGNYYPVWGGSWAIRRDVFEEIGLRQAWQNTLSDDLVASRVLRNAKLNVRFEPHCMAQSSMSLTLGEAIEFMRRQYLIGRRYATRWWGAAVAGHLLTQTVMWFGLLAAVGGWSGDTRWQLTGVACFLTTYALIALRAYWRQSLANAYAPNHQPILTRLGRLEVALAPVIGSVNLLLMLSSAVGSQIRWRGIYYWISPGGRILLLGREYTPRSKQTRIASDGKHETTHPPLRLLQFVQELEPKDVPIADDNLPLFDEQPPRKAAQ